MTTTILPTSELEAVNTCLAAIGESPVNSIESTELVTVVLAKQFLSECSKALQAQPWSFNTDYNYELSRDGDGKIPVPSNALRVDTTDEYRDYDVVQRAGFLYNRAKQTFVFDKNMKCDVTWIFPFDQLPEAARWYITVAAARKLQVRMLPSESRERFTSDDEARAWAAFNEAEGDQGDYNMFDGSWSVANILQRNPY